MDGSQFAQCGEHAFVLLLQSDGDAQPLRQSVVVERRNGNADGEQPGITPAATASSEFAEARPLPMELAFRNQLYRDTVATPGGD